MILKLRGARARSLCTLSCRWRNPVSVESQQIHVFVCSARRGLFGGSRARNSTPEGGTDASSSVWRKKFEGSCVMQDLYFAASVSPPLLAVLQCQYPALPLPFFFFPSSSASFFFLCGDSGSSESLGWKTADAENFWDYYYHQIHDKTKSTTWNCFT